MKINETRKHLIAAIQTVRDTPNLIEGTGYTLEDFDKTTSEFIEDWDNFESLFISAEECEDPIYQYGKEILLKDTQEHQIIKDCIQNLHQKIWTYLCEFMPFLGWQSWEVA